LQFQKPLEGGGDFDFVRDDGSRGEGFEKQELASGLGVEFPGFEQGAGLAFEGFGLDAVCC